MWPRTSYSLDKTIIRIFRAPGRPRVTDHSRSTFSRSSPRVWGMYEYPVPTISCWGGGGSSNGWITSWWWQASITVSYWRWGSDGNGGDLEFLSLLTSSFYAAARHHMLSLAVVTVDLYLNMILFECFTPYDPRCTLSCRFSLDFSKATIHQ